jgi:hypothetical protein
MRPSSSIRTAALVVGAALVATFTAGLPAVADEAPSRTFESGGNPIIGDGSYYSADAAPLVVDETLYIYTGHDEASPQQASFVMRDYGVLATDDVDAGTWTHWTGNLVPGDVFAWATGNAAYAGQVVQGPDERFYWYTPVEWDNPSVPNRMAIGVAVSDSPVGPWHDAIGSPLLTWTDVFGSSTSGQEVIDPHVFIDLDGRVYLYWGSWGVARVVELEPTMTALRGEITTLSGLTSFFEAPWVFERGGTYYLVYDWKRAGSECTPSNYQACVAYATADGPLGPWTYQGIILGGTSATTVHPSVIEFDGRWWLTYHTKDAVGGGHFRRSVAIDEVTWDGDRMLPVTQTWADDPAFRLGDNVAVGAQVSASYTEQPPMRLGALNDGRALTAVLPPDLWGNYRGTTSSNPSDWVMYEWEAPVRTASVGIQFHRDSNWIRSPASWVVEYRDADGDWRPVEGAEYPTATDVWHTVSFAPVTTTALRATFRGLDDGAYVHSVAVSEWEVYAVQAHELVPTEMWTEVGEPPHMPGAVRLPFESVGNLWVPVNWRAVDPAAYATAGTFTVEGRALGQAGGYVTAVVRVGGEPIPEPVDTAPPTVAVAVSGTSGVDGWFSGPVTARVLADDETSYLLTVEVRVDDGEWSTSEGVRNADITLADEGEHIILGRARDGAGNTSEPVSRTVWIDRSAPELSALLHERTRTVRVEASDALSGLDRVEYRIDGAGEWAEVASDGVVEMPDALPHEVVVRAHDRAGNVATVTVAVPLEEGAVLTGNVAPYATPSAAYTSPWESVAGLNDGSNDVFEADPTKLGASWGTWDRVGQQWAQLTWAFDVTVDQVGAWWYRDAADSQNSGMIPPRSWALEYLEADGVTWRPVTLLADLEYGRTSDGFAQVTFEPVATQALRVVAEAWGAGPGGGSIGIREWQVIAAPVLGTEVEAAVPEHRPATCTAGAETPAVIVIPEVRGVVYWVRGEVVSGEVEVPVGGTVVVLARPAEGFTLAGPRQGVTWRFSGKGPSCAE